MMKKNLSLIVLFLLIAMTPKTQPLNDNKILQHPEIQRAISQNPHLEMKLRELVERLPSNLTTEYLVRRIASILETCREPEELEIYFNELMRASRNFSEQMLENQWADIPIKKANNAPLTPPEREIITTVIEDFQVNENVGSCDQWNPTIAADNYGNFVIAWEDSRNGQKDIYARCYDSDGNPKNFSFLVSNLSESAAHNPDIAMDGKGNFVITWTQEGRRLNPDIYAQRYNSNCVALGINFKVNDDYLPEWPWGYWQDSPAIAADSLGFFVITWHDLRNSWTGGDIYAQIFDSSGAKNGANFIVNDDTASSLSNSQSLPDIAAGTDGEFIITWIDNRNGDYDIYAQRFDSDGDTIGINFKINDDNEKSKQKNPTIAIDNFGNFFIAWCDNRDLSWDIFAQRFHVNGNAKGGNFKVNDDNGNNYQYDPTIAINKSGYFSISWMDNRNGDNDIFAQCYDSAGQALNINFRITNNIVNNGPRFPTIVSAKEGNFLVAWHDCRNGDFDIYAQLINYTGSTLGVNYKINDDLGSSWQIHPSMAIDRDGNFTIVWEDYRNESKELWGDIYIKKYNANGEQIKASYKVNDDFGRYRQFDPDIAMDIDGNFKVVWEDWRGGNGDIYGQNFTASGNLSGENYQISDVGIWNQYDPAIALNESDYCVITWEDWRNGDGDIYAACSMCTTNFRVNDEIGNSWQGQPDVTIDKTGGFIVTWTDLHNNNKDIYAQRYDSLGAKIGANFKINDDIGDSYQSYSAVAFNNDGNFMITWEDYRNDGRNIYAQYYDNDGNAQRVNFRVNDPPFNGFKPSIASDHDGNFVITWQFQNYGQYDIYAQCYNKLGKRLSKKNFRVNNDSTRALQGSPCVATYSNSIYFSWEDNRVPGQGWDIFAKIMEIDSILDVCSVMGSISYYSDSLKMVNDALVSLSGAGENEDTTRNNGSYNFSNLRSGDYSTKPSKENDLDNAISALDAAWILLNDVDLIEFSPYQNIAADVSGNGEPTGYDASFVLRYVVGLIDSFPVMPDKSRFWTFVPTNFPIDSTNWSTAPDSLNYQPLISDTLDQDFVGIIYGDVTGNWSPTTPQFTSKKISSKTFNLHLGEITWHENNIYSTSIEIDKESDLMSASFGIEFDPKIIKVLDVKLSHLTTNFSSAYKINERQLKIALAGSKYLKEGGAIVNISYKILEKSSDSSYPFSLIEAILNEGGIITNVHQANNNLLPSIPIEFALSQNYPNPFNSETIINYQLPKTCKVTLRILNLLGQQVKTLIDETMEAGYQKVSWNGKNNSGINVASGIYLYCIEAEKFRQVRKLIIIR